MFVEQKILFNFWFRPNNNTVFLARYINFNLNAFTKNKIRQKIANKFKNKSNITILI